MILAISIIVGIALAAYLVVNFYPPLGGKASEERKQANKRSKNFSSKGKFVNLIPTSMEMSVSETVRVMFQFMKGNPIAKPSKQIVPQSISPTHIQENNEAATLTWFGHSALLLTLEGKTLFIDPMLGRSPSPFSYIGGKRFSDTLPIEIADLPTIDAVLLTHDHYDHLDYGSIMKLKHKVKRFIVPLGVAAHLERWGVEAEKISQHDWWDELTYEGLSIACTPARHFSGRSLTDRNSTLWCSWVVAGQHTKLFFSGDSGYGPHFQEIGDKYGPFDLTLMECGQYDPRWASIHMLPEETVQAHLDVKGKLLIPIHWGAFMLALHEWTDPVERAVKAAQKLGVAISTPRIGEPVTIGGAAFPVTMWWR